MECFPMAKNKTFGGVDFVHFKLSAEEKKKFQKWSDQNADDVFTHIHLLITQDYRLSVSYSLKDSTAIASVTCKDESSVNNQRCVSSRHADPLVAVLIACYKIEEVMGDGDWLELAQADDWG